jgi:Tfp pilus assembly PilM family ATPase
MHVRNNKGWIGIDVGKTRLKIVQLAQAGGGVRIAGSAVADREGSELSEGAVTTGIGDIGRQVMSAIRETGTWTGRRVACMLPMSLTDVRILKIPASGPSERRSLVAQELLATCDRADDQVFDTWLCPPAGGEDNFDVQDVGVVSVARQHVERILGELARAGLRCEVLDGPPLVMARAVRLMGRGLGEKVVAAIDWGYDSGIFCAVRGGLPVYTRHLRHCGLAQLIRAVREALKLQVTEAFEVLEKHGLPDPNRDLRNATQLQEALAEITAEPLGEFVEQLKRTISYLQNQQLFAAPRELVLMGDGAGLRNIACHLSNAVSMPVFTWHLPDGGDQPGTSQMERSEILAGAAALSNLGLAS